MNRVLSCMLNIPAGHSRIIQFMSSGLRNPVTVQRRFLVFASSVNQGNHFTARFITAATILKPKNPASANMMHPIPNACRFRRSIPAFFMPGSRASSICVFFERFGMYLKSNVVSSPRPLLFLIMTCQNTLRSAWSPFSASVQRLHKVLTYRNLPSVKVWYRSVCVADGHKKKALPNCQGPVVNAWSADTECIT